MRRRETTPRAEGRRLALASVLLLSLLPLAPGPAAAAPPPSGGSCVLVPVLRDFTVNQGVGSPATAAGSYNPLTRGKETLARLYLSKPDCATERNQTLSLTGATLTMSIPGAPSKTYTTLNPVSASSPAPLTAAASAPAPDASSDPKFVIPGTDFVSPDPSARFTPTFTATLTYSSATASTNPPITFDAVSGGGPPLTATVEARTKALRVLVVSMGAQLTSTDSSTLQAGLNSLSQKLPVPKAGGQLTGPLSATSNVGGIRYAVNAGVASVPLQASTGKYCGNLNNFDSIKAQLAQYRNDWNVANSATGDADTSPTADIVLGVVSAGISLGSASGCAEGMASTNTPVAWVRLVPPGTGPSTAGNLMAMEVAHTFNASGSWGDPASPTHSRNTQADAGLNRAYNITSRAFLSDDRSTMKAQSTGWNQDTTVYEQRDFNFLLCRLGGAPNEDCLTTGTVGTVNGVAGGPAFVLSGTTDNTPAGTRVVEAFHHAETPLTPLQPPGPYRVEFGAGADVASRFVPVEFRTSEHVHDGADDEPAPLGLISFTVPFELGSKEFRFFYDPPGDAPEVLLFSSRENGRPALRDLTVQDGGGGGFVNYTQSAGDDQAVALSHDGRWVAWVGSPDGRALEVAAADDRQASDVLYLDGGADPLHLTLTPDGRSLAFSTTDGHIGTVDVDLSSGAPVFDGQPQLVYSAGDLPQADNPSFSPDGTQLAFDAGGRIWRMQRDGSELTPLTPEPGEDGLYAVDPSWSQTAGDDRIAYAGTGPDAQPSGIYTVSADAAEHALLAGDGGSEPSWGTDGLIAYVLDGRIVTTPAQPPLSFDRHPEAGGSEVLTPQAGPALEGVPGRSPAYVRPGTSAFVAGVPADFCEGELCSQDEVFLERAGLSVSAVAGVDGGDTSAESLGNLRLTLYYRCPGTPERSVLGLALAPTSIEPAPDGTGSARFRQTFEQSQLCGGDEGGVLTGVVSDFFSSGPFPQDPDFDPLVQDEQVAASAQGPVPSIVYPAQHATFLEWQSIPLQGEGMDAALQQVPDGALTWEVADRSATGSTVDLARLPVGDHVVTLRATDPATGLSEQTSRTIHVLGDRDRDGMSDLAEQSAACFPADAASDGTSAERDSDGDGIPDGQDPHPCAAAAALHPTTVFDPATLHVPSRGSSVTMYVRQDKGVPDLAGVVAGSVRIVSITGVLKSGVASTVSTADQPFARNKGWSVAGVVDHAQVGTAKFDRQGLNAFIADRFRLDQRLTVTLGGYSSLPSYAFTGAGTTNAKKG